MLDDRHYMRPDSPHSRVPLGLMMPFTTILMIVLTVAFALQQIDMVYVHSPALAYLILKPSDVAHGYVWELLTFQFLHMGLWHLFGNLIGIYFFGRFVEERLGRIEFLKLYFLSGIAGGLLQCALGWIFPSFFGFPTVGASAGVFGLITAFAALEPEADILLMFVLPLKAKYLLYVSAAVAVFFTIVPAEPGIAHAAHLGGILFALAYIRRRSMLDWDWHRFNLLRRRARGEKMIKAATVKTIRPRRPELEETTELPSGEFISKEVDPILDKISAHGIQSLTERERKILQVARSKMAKR